METKKRLFGWPLHLLGAAILLAGLAACGSSEGSIDEEQPDKPKPVTPVNDGDWQTVPVTGGTITKDSISITFPSGTFTEETKVAITEIQKGKIGGEYEASKFYQIAMPCIASKPIEFKIKSKEIEGNICFVAQADAFSVCSGETRKVEHHYEASYSNGEYSSTIPAINGDADENIYFTLGLGRILDPSTGKARTREGNSFKNQVLFEGKVKNVNYQIRYMWTILDQIKWSINGDETFDKIINISGKVHDYVKESMTKIMDLGFKVEGSPTIYIDFDTSEKDWGGHQFCALPLSTSWSTYVSLGTKKLLEIDTTDEDIKCTVIHEVFHWFQTHYDPRSNWKKAKGSGDYIIFYEMGGAWIENLMNDGQLNAKWLNNDILKEHVTAGLDKFGLTDTKKRIGNNQQQGYLMAPLLYYMCSSNAMKEFGFSNKSVVELHELFTGGFKVEASLNPFADDYFVGTLNIMNDWAKIYHDSNFFTGTQIDDYYLKLLNGTLVKGTDIFAIWEAYKSEPGSRIIKKVSDASPEYKGDNLYPYGCNFRAYHLMDFKDISLKDKKLVFKQTEEGVQTYVLAANKTDKKYERIGTVAKGQDSIVISGSKLESYRKADGTFDQYFFIITTRTNNYPTDTGSMPWRVTVELQQEKEDITHFPGDVYRVDVSVLPYWRVDYLDNDGKVVETEEGESFFSIIADTTTPDPNDTPTGKLYFAYSQSSIHVEGIYKTDGAWAQHNTFSFDIVGIDNGFDNSKVQNLSMKLHSLTDSPWEHTAEASNIPYYTKTTEGGTIQYFGKVSDGVKLSNVTKYAGKNTSYTYIEKPNNRIQISIRYRSR